MAADNPRQASIDFLTEAEGPVIADPEPDALVLLENGQWARKGIRRHGGGMGAKASTVQFVKERSTPNRQIHAVTYEDAVGHSYLFVCVVTLDGEGNWRVEAGGGGGDAGENPARLGRSYPWANLAGGGWETNFWAGGRITDAGSDVVRVRLIGSNGEILEDVADDTGLVLFIAVPGQIMRVPVQVELYTRTGELAGRHTWFANSRPARSTT